jgi:hypothetical protein
MLHAVLTVVSSGTILACSVAKMPARIWRKSLPSRRQSNSLTVFCMILLSLIKSVVPSSTSFLVVKHALYHLFYDLVLVKRNNLLSWYCRNVGINYMWCANIKYLSCRYCRVSPILVWGYGKCPLVCDHWLTRSENLLFG